MGVLTQAFMKLEVDTSTSGGPTYETVRGVTNLAGGGRPGNQIDTTSYDTPPGQSESIEGPRGNAAFTADIHYEPGDAVQELVFIAEATNSPKRFRIKAGTKSTTFRAVPILTLAAPVAGKVTYSMGLAPLAAALSTGGGVPEGFNVTTINGVPATFQGRPIYDDGVTAYLRAA